MAATGVKALGAVEFLRICGRLKVRRWLVKYAEVAGLALSWRFAAGGSG